MKKIFIILGLCLAGIFCAAHTYAKEYQIPEGGISFCLPDSWRNASRPADALYMYGSPDDSIAVLFWVPKVSSFSEGVSILTKELEKHVKNITLTTNGKEDVVNGIKGYVVSGKGTMDGAPVEWEVVLFEGSKAPIISLSFTKPGAEKSPANAEAIIEFYQTVKKL